MNQFKNCPLVYISWRDENIEKQPSFQRLLEIIGCDIDKIQQIKNPTQFERVIIPDSSFISYDKVNGFSNEYRETIDRVRNFALKNRTPTSCKKIYYFHGRKRQVGEERLAEYFHSKGYDIVSPEKLTLDEQLNLLINCENFATTIGSISHNSIFLKDKTEAIFIPRSLYVFKGHQDMLNQVNSLRASYVDSALSIFSASSIDGPLCYIISEQLKRFFGDKFDGYEEEDFKTFLQYVKNAMSNNLKIKPLIKSYYDAFLPDFIAQLKNHADLIEDYDMQLDWDTFQPLISYRTHVHERGWRDGWKDENQISNPLDQKLDVQAIKVSFPTWVHKLYYSVYFNDEEGWSEEILAPEMAGTTGKMKSIYGMRVRLDEAGAKEFDIFYRMHKFDGTWTPWAKNGENLYSYGQKLNAIQIKLESKT